MLSRMSAVDSKLRVTPPRLKLSKNPGPTCKPIQKTKRIRPKSCTKVRIFVGPVNPTWPATIPANNTKAVSYTHLGSLYPWEVYRELAQESGRPFACDVSLGAYQPQCADDRFLPSLCYLQAVSYTHLDVYKRQMRAWWWITRKEILAFACPTAWQRCPCHYATFA